MATKTEANVNQDSLTTRRKIKERLPKELNKINPRKPLKQPKPDKPAVPTKPDTLSNIYPSDIEKPEVKLENLYKKPLTPHPTTLGSIDNETPIDVTVSEIDNVNPVVKAKNKVTDIQDIDTTKTEKKTLGNLNVYGTVENRNNTTSLPNVND
jgi:hypothetical protein